MKFAQIIKNKVHWVGEYDKAPNFHANAGLFVDITDNPIDIKERFLYNNGVFTDAGQPKPTPQKTKYTKVEFLNRIPKAVRQQVKAEELAGTPSVLDWIFIFNAMIDVDLNDLPDGFIEGLDAMAINEKISLNQNQIDNFLER